MGASNSDEGMVESLAETQEIAVKAAFADVRARPRRPWTWWNATPPPPCRGTARRVQALKAFFPQGQTTHLTSFKSQIGHTLGASGLNSLIRGVMAMQAGVIPPSLNYDTPDPQIDLGKLGVPGSHDSRGLAPARGSPRRLMVNAFGFGGANYVVHLEENQDGAGPGAGEPPGRPKLIAAGERRRGQAQPPVTGISFFRASHRPATYRLAVLADSDREAREKAGALKPLEDEDSPHRQDRRGLERQGFFLGPEAPAGPLPWPWSSPARGPITPAWAKELMTGPFPPSAMDGPPGRGCGLRSAASAVSLPDENLQRTLWQQPALFTLNYSVVRYLLDNGPQPTAMAGHSLGELVALSVAGVFSYEDGFRIVHKRAQCMDKAGDIKGDPGTMIAVNVPLDILERKGRRPRTMSISPTTTLPARSFWEAAPPGSFSLRR